MSIPAKKADGITPAYDIKIKRTQLSNDDEKLQTGVLEYGELLYNKKEGTIQVGDGSTVVTESPILKLRDRDQESRTTFIDKRQVNDLVTLKDENNKPVYGKTKFWTTRGSDGIPRDSGGNAIQLKSKGTWYKVTEKGIGDSIPSTDKTTLPRAQKIPVKGVTEDDVVQISMAISNSDSTNVDYIKSSEKVFGTIYAVESYGTNATDGGIIVYVKKYRDNSCYIDVFGG